MYIMNVIIIILVILLAVLYLCSNNFESFSIPKLDKFTFVNDTLGKKCVIKKIVNDNQFSYTYSITDNCDNSSNNTRIIKENDIIDGKPFQLADCNESKFGSCRKRGFECVDFMTSEDCNKYNMLWSKQTCQDKLPYVIKYPEYAVTSSNVIPSSNVM